MKKTLLIAGAAALLAVSAPSAFAQSYYGGSPYFRAPSGYAEYVRQMRACQRHAREHQELGQVHAEEHYEGLESRGDHRDLHDDLDAAHDAYHADHPRADFCNRYYTQRYRPAYRYGYPQNGYGYNYGNGYYNYNNGYYNNGLSFGFSYGR